RRSCGSWWRRRKRGCSRRSNRSCRSNRRCRCERRSRTCPTATTQPVDRDSVAWTSRGFEELIDHYKERGVPRHRYLERLSGVVVRKVIRAGVGRIKAAQIEIGEDTKRVAECDRDTGRIAGRVL